MITGGQSAGDWKQIKQKLFKKCGDKHKIEVNVKNETYRRIWISDTLIMNEENLNLMDRKREHYH